MFMAVHRAAQKSSEAETLQKVPPHTLDRGEIGQSLNELRSFAQSSSQERGVTLASGMIVFRTTVRALIKNCRKFG